MLDREDFPPLPSQKRLQDDMQSRSKRTGAMATRKSGCMASINDLPDELILEILEYLPCLDQEDFQLLSLVSLSRTNRRLHNLVVEKLYASFDSFFCAPYPFLRSVMSDQQLAARIRSMTFKYGVQVHAERAPYQPSAADKKIIKEGLKKVLGVPAWKAWASDCNDPGAEQELLYATILMHTPNVVALDIDDGNVPYKIPKWLDLIRWVVNGSHVDRLHRFTHLKSIRIDVWFLKLRHLAPIFRLQSLRRVRMVGLIDANEAEERKTTELERLVPPASSPVEELSFRDSFVDIGALSTVLGYIRGLKHFEYGHTDEKWDSHGRASEDYWLKSRTFGALTMNPSSG